MTEEEKKRYRAHIQGLLNQEKELVLSEISDEDLVNEIGRRLKAEKTAILGSAEALKGGIQHGWH